MKSAKKKELADRNDFNLSAKQEAFCVAVASGLNLSDAYRNAGYSCCSLKTVNEAASRLQKNSKISARIEVLRKPIVEQAQITLESHLEELKEIRDQAKASLQYSAAISAEIARGKASGLYVKRTEISNDMKIQNMSDKELHSKIAELIFKSENTRLVI